jgi:hypothetical protein
MAADLDGNLIRVDCNQISLKRKASWRRMTRVKPKLTLFAASRPPLVMILAAVFRIVRGEYKLVIINLGLGAIRVHRDGPEFS